MENVYLCANNVIHIFIMKKNFCIFTITLLTLTSTFTSCSALTSFSSVANSEEARAHLIRRGMTSQEVLKTMKRVPNYRRFSDDHHEQWEYDKSWYMESHDVLLIDFEDNRVVSMDAFRKSVPRPATVNVEQKNED